MNFEKRGNDINSTVENQQSEVNTTPQTLVETEELLKDKKELLKNIDSDFFGVGKEEYNELKNRYSNLKKKYFESKDYLGKQNIRNLLDGLKKEFESDIKGIKKFDKFKKFKGYEQFKEIIVNNLIPEEIEEKVFSVFEKYSIEELEKFLSGKMPIDEVGIEDLIKNIENKNPNLEKITEQLKLENRIKNAKPEDLKQIKKDLFSYIKYLKQNGDYIAIKSLISLFKNKKIELEKETNKYKEGNKEYKEGNKEYKEGNKEYKELNKEYKELNKEYKELNKEYKEGNKEYLYNKKEEQESIIDEYLLKLNNIKNIAGDIDIAGLDESILKLKINKNNLADFDFSFDDKKISEDNLVKTKEFIEKIEKSNDELIKTLDKLDVNSIRDLFAKLKKKDEEAGISIDSSDSSYARMYNAMLEYSPSLAQKVQNSVSSPDKVNFQNNISDIRKTQISSVTGLTEKEIENISGDKFFSSETGKGIDFSKTPPEVFIMNQESGYKLDSGLPEIPEELNDKREELAKYNINANKEINSLKTNLQFKKEKLEELKNFGDNIGVETEKVKNEIRIIEEKIKKIQIEMKSKNNIFNLSLKKYFDNIKNKLKEKDNNQQKTLKFLNNIGFDLISQNATDKIIDLVNKTNMKLSLGFSNKINLAEGDLGLNKDQDINEISTKEKEQFSKFTNILISGDENKPIDLTTVGTMSITFLSDELDDNGKNKKLDKLSLSSYINNKMGSNPFSVIVNNLNNYYKGNNLEKLNKNQKELDKKEK